MRHGKGLHREGCAYCGNKRTKMRGGRPVCRACRMILDAGLEPRK